MGLYCDKLGHELIWRTKTAAGLKMPDTDAELVVHAEFKESETDILVDSVNEAVTRFIGAGGVVVKPPFGIEIGRCAVVKDPFGNALVVLDMSKGAFRTDQNKHMI